MDTLGIDIGSRSTEFVWLKDLEVADSLSFETSFDPLKDISLHLEKYPFKKMVATGYGRTLLQKKYACDVVTEIKAYALSLKHLYPENTLILDIGGQDTKVIELDEKGLLKKFEMNDKCAAGTGKFLEIMALTLGVPLEEFKKLPLKAQKKLQINNTCTVFAESEVVSLLTQGERMEDLAYAVHLSCALRASLMIKRFSLKGDSIIFAGGVALNESIVKMLEEDLKKKIIVPSKPQFLGALGAALSAVRSL